MEIIIYRYMVGVLLWALSGLVGLSLLALDDRIHFRSETARPYTLIAGHILLGPVSLLTGVNTSGYLKWLEDKDDG